MERLFEGMQRRLEATSSTFLRYVYPAIDWDARLLGLTGPRGVGKTTLILQHIKLAHPDSGTALYVSADDIYFANHGLLATAEAFNKAGGTHLFIDEVHRYPAWASELQAIYDTLPDMHVCFAGPSILENESTAAELLEMAPVHRMQGLSFREFLAIREGIEFEPFSLQQILANEAVIPGVKHPLPLFAEYLRTGYYPYGPEPFFSEGLARAIERTLEVDIPQVAGMNAGAGMKLKRLLAAVGSADPRKPNMSRLGALMGVSRNNVENYLGYLEQAGMISQVRKRVKGQQDAARGAGEDESSHMRARVEKVYLDNTNILHFLADGVVEESTIRRTFFNNQARVLGDVRAASAEGFKLGGAAAGSVPNRGLVLKADIERGQGNVVPLWAFGLGY